MKNIPTFFTSNLDLKNLETHLSITSSGIEEIKAGRIISRIKQLTEVKEMVSEKLKKITNLSFFICQIKISLC